MKYQVLLSEEDGWIIAEVPALPGCVSQGKTREEALEKIKDAIHGCVEARKAHGLFVPFEFVEVEVAA